MDKFKVGDTIRIIDDSDFWNVCIGDIATITDITNNEITFMVDRLGIKQMTFIGDNDIELICHNKNYNKIIFNPPATILFKGVKKYVAKCHADDEFNEEIGLMVVLLKSFGIKYKDLQEMLKDAKRPKSKIEEVDVNEGKSFVEKKGDKHDK